MLLTRVSNEVGTQIILKLFQLKEAEEGLSCQTKASDSFASNLLIIFVIRTELAAPVVLALAGLQHQPLWMVLQGMAGPQKAQRKALLRDHSLDLLPALQLVWEPCICKEG